MHPPETRVRFLEEVRKTGGTITLAANNAGVSPASIYNWRKADPEFDDAIREAQRDCIDQVENAMYEAATFRRHKYRNKKLRCSECGNQEFHELKEVLHSPTDRIFYLANRDTQRWKRQDSGVTDSSAEEIAKLMLQFQSEAEDLTNANEPDDTSSNAGPTADA